MLGDLSSKTLALQNAAGRLAIVLRLVSCPDAIWLAGKMQQAGWLRREKGAQSKVT